MEDITTQLRQRLLSVQRAVDSGVGTEYIYIPSEVRQLLTLADIEAYLALLPALRNDQRDIRRYAAIIHESAHLIFSILLSDGHGEHILKFVSRRETDNRIPYSKDGLYFLPDLASTHFLTQQWHFAPVHLKSGEIHRDINSESILPFVSQSLVGSGAFGKVWKVKMYVGYQSLVPEEPGQETFVARKELGRNDSGEQERTVLDLLRVLKHPHIVDFLGSYHYHGICNLLFPLAPMNLRTFLFDKPNPLLDIHLIYAGIYGIADALHKIHEFEFEGDGLKISKVGYHHDLRPANILVDHGVFLIADFGLSKLKPDDQDSSSVLRGGQDDYLAPECFDHDRWSKGLIGRASDVWALGCITTELATFIERRDVGLFRASRKTSHGGGGIQQIDCAFHLNGKVRPAVEYWLQDLLQEPQDAQVTGLIGIAREMLLPNHYKRPRIGDFVSKLECLALDSAFAAVSQAFEEVSASVDGAPLSNLQVWTLLEHKRLQAWWSLFQAARPPREKFSTSRQMIDLMRHLQDILRRHDQLLSDAAAQPPLELLNEVDRLCQVLPCISSEQIEQTWSRTVCDTENLDILQAIRSAPKPERYRSVGVKAAMAHMSRAISRSIQVGKRSRYMDSAAIEPDRNPWASLPEGCVRDESKCMGYYYEEDAQKKRVLIEWKAYDARWKSRAEELHSLMDDLTNLLDPNETPRDDLLAYRMLNCIGYFHEARNARFGFVFDLRPTPNPAVQLYSLNSVLRMTSADCKHALRPNLGDVFSLAQDLAGCLLNVHKVGWLHKSLSSHHILIFSPSVEDVSNYVRSAVLSGFNDSRPEASSLTLGPWQQIAPYKHPRYLSQTPFRRTFDYFGLGLILLELGLWLPISDIRSDHPEICTDEDFRLKLLNSYVPQLGEKMGTCYRDAVHFCMDAENELEIDLTDEKGVVDKERLHSAFKARVVDPLSRCYA